MGHHTQSGATLAPTPVVQPKAPGGAGLGLSALARRLVRLLRILLVAFAAVVLVAPAGTAGTATPFKSTFTAQASFAPTQTPGVFAGTGSGAGRASHLGRVTLSSTETLDFAASPGSVLVREGRMVTVAANGDELHWTYDGTGSLPDENGAVTLSGTFVITGGTGRFSDASGGGTFQGVGNVGTGVASLSYEGAISY